MNDQLLKDLKIIDFSHRLPGPLAGNLLAGLGAKVIKIEDHKFKDAFLTGLFAEMDESFKEWYTGLNDKKEIIRFDFKSLADGKKIQQLVQTADGVLMALPPKVRAALKLTNQDLAQLPGPLAVIEMGASKTIKKSMHDLNAMAYSGLLSLHLEGRSEAIIDPPLLPISGITFGQKLALDFMAAIFKSKQENSVIHTTTYLYESALETLDPFWPKSCREKKQTKFLHNGAYPCYTLYRLADGSYAALAAVEEKFWLRFCELFAVELPAKERFRRDPESFQMVYQKLKSLNASEVAEKIKNEDICLTLVN